MDDKLQYISKIKEERNKAQDELAELRKILELSDDISLTEHITKIKINIDKELLNQYYNKYKEVFFRSEKDIITYSKERGSGRVPFYIS